MSASLKAEIVQLASVARSSPDMSSSSLIVIGTEGGSIVLVDSRTFNAVSKVLDAGAPTRARFVSPPVCVGGGELFAECDQMSRLL